MARENKTVEIPADLRELMRSFAVLRTMAAHADPVTSEIEGSDEQLAEEMNDWIKNNPPFTKQDLNCLKMIFQKHNFSKSFWHNLLQDMRGKTYYDLFQRLGQDYERWTGSFKPMIED